MLKSILPAIIATALGLSPSSPRTAQKSAIVGGPCASDTAKDARGMLTRYRGMMHDYSVSALERSVVAIDKVDPATIVIVTDTAVCRPAGIAYGRAFGDTTSDRSMNVVKIGNRYVVRDPGSQLLRGVFLTFDSTFATKLSQTR